MPSRHSRQAVAQSGNPEARTGLAAGSPVGSAQGLGFGDDGSWDSPCVQCRCGHLSPHPWRCGSIGVPLPATGRGWAHSPSSWQRAAPGRRAEWLEIREARWQPFPVKCQQWRGAGDRPSGSRWIAASGRPGNAGKPKLCPRDRNRWRGCRKAAQGPEQGLREPDGVPREARPKPPGPGGTGPGLP